MPILVEPVQNALLYGNGKFLKINAENMSLNPCRYNAYKKFQVHVDLIHIKVLEKTGKPINSLNRLVFVKSFLQ